MFDPDLYKKALDFAARAHGDQRISGSGFPYVVHLSKVAMETINACAVDRTLDSNLAVCCALLHDTIEDAGVSKEEIEREFGAAVARGVVALSKNPALPKDVQMADALERIRAEPREIWVVKLADRITNLEPPPPKWSPDKVRGYRAEAEMIADRLSEASSLLAGRIAEKIRGY